MASVVKRPNGHKWLQYTHGGRHTIRLGKTSLKNARDIKHHIENLLDAKRNGAAIGSATEGWLGEIGPALLATIARQGLTAATAGGPEAVSLRDLQAYTSEQYADMNARTQRNISRAWVWLLAYPGFSGSLPISAISPGDVSDWRRWLGQQGLAETYVSDLIKKARRIFNMGKDKRWLAENPFIGQKGLIDVNPDRQHFVAISTVESLLEHCDPETQLAVVLLRFGGLRGSSELDILKWESIDLPNLRMLVYSPKMHRHATKAWRTVPIFPQIAPHLERAWERAEDGAEFVFSTRDPSGRKWYARVIRGLKAASIAPWPKLFTNMRSSRETELMEEHPAFVVVSWMGNSIKIAEKHYLQVTDDHFRKATSKPSSEGEAKGEAFSSKKPPTAG